MRNFFNNGSLFYFHEDIIVTVTTYYLKPESQGQPRFIIQPHVHISNYKKRFSRPLHMSPVDRAGFLRSRLTSKSFIKFSMCSYERAGWLGSRDLRFSNRDLASVSVLKFFGHMNTSARLPRWKRDEFCRPGRHLPIACCIFHAISIPFNCSDTAIRVAIAMKDANSR